MKHFLKTKYINHKTIIRKTIVRTLLKVFRVFNNNGLFAYAKDINVDVILGYLSGMYFDVDISPREKNPFFNAMNSIPLVLNVLSLTKNVILRFPFLRFDDPTLPAGSQINQNVYTDVSFALFVNCSNFKANILNDVNTRRICNISENELNTTYISPLLAQNEHAKLNSDTFYRFIAPLTSEKSNAVDEEI